MKKIKIKTDTVCGGKVVRVGDVVEASDYDARLLVTMGKAKPFVEKSDIETAGEPDVDNREDEISLSKRAKGRRSARK